MSGEDLDTEEVKRMAKEALDSIPLEDYQQVFEDCDKKIAAGTADEQCYLLPARFYFEGIGVQKDRRKALEYIYKLMRVNPDAGIKEYTKMVTKDETIADLKGVDPHEEEIRGVVEMVWAADQVQRGGIDGEELDQLDPEQRAQLEEMIQLIPSIKASLKDL